MSLRVDGLRTGYVRGQTVLDDISFSLDRGQILGVLGRNGAGKTTLARTIMGLLAPWDGRVTLDDKQLPNRTSTRRRIQLGVCLVPENRQIFGNLTVEENLTLAKSIRKVLPSAPDLAAEMFPILSERRSQLAAGLSGGQQQMLAIARALAIRPNYLIVDEPSLGLAASVVDDLTLAFRRIADEGVGILLIEQNVGMVESLCESALMLRGDGGAHLTRFTDAVAQDLIHHIYLGA